MDARNTILVAFDDKRAIGKEGKLPWHIAEDLKLFKQTTMGHPIIMGSNTWNSLPKKPLFGRSNIVITRDWKKFIAEKPDENVYFINSPEQALSLARTLYGGGIETFVIGGSQIYKAFLDAGLVDYIIVSKIPGDYNGDVFFPELGDEWECISEEARVNFTVQEYRKSV